MNLPPGNMVKTGLETTNVNFNALVNELVKMKFNGYVAITAAGASGIEEGILIFDDGKTVASTYEYLAFKKLILGKDAFIRVLNISASTNGVIDVIELTNEQVHLILAFTEASIYVPDATELASVPKSFSVDLEASVRAVQMPATRNDLLKKYRLADTTMVAKQTESTPNPPENTSVDLLKQLSEEAKSQQELKSRIQTV